MKRMFLLALVLVSAAPLLTACARKVPFVQTMRSQYNLGPDELKQLQYYVSGPIVLQREMSNQETGVTPGHKLTLVKDKRVEEVIVPGGTPGVCVDPGSTTLRIKFEEADSLTFGLDPANREVRNGRYPLLVQDARPGEGQVTYEGKSFRVLRGGRSVYLIVGLEQLQKFEKESRKAKGIVLP